MSHGSPSSTEQDAAQKRDGASPFDQVAALRGSRHESGEFTDDVPADDEGTAKTVAIFGVAATRAMLGTTAPHALSEPGAALIPQSAAAIAKYGHRVDEILRLKPLMTSEQFRRIDERTRRRAEKRWHESAQSIAKAENLTDAATKRAAVAKKEKRHAKVPGASILLGPVEGVDPESSSEFEISVFAQALVKAQYEDPDLPENKARDEGRRAVARMRKAGLDETERKIILDQITGPKDAHPVDALADVLRIRSVTPKQPLGKVA